MAVAGLAVALTAQRIGLSKAPPEPMSRVQCERLNPPTDALVDAVVPAPVKKALKRKRKLPPVEQAIVAAAEAKRARRRARNLKAVHRAI